MGHFVRLPFEGGELEDISPGLPRYSSWFLVLSRICNRLGYMAATKDGFQFYWGRKTCLKQSEW